MTNSTDAMKDTINTMFAEPIKEVQVAYEILRKDVNNATLCWNGAEHLEDLQEKIDALKSMLPTVQGL